MNIEISIFNLIHNLAGRFWLLDWLGIFFAQYSVYLIILFAIFIFFREKNWRERIYFLSLAGLSVILSRGIITEIIRFIYFRPRPFIVLNFQPLISHDLNASFPSGHAAAYFALILAIFYFIYQRKNKYLWWPFIPMILMGLSRIFVGVHWPSDVLIGALIGLGSAFVIKKIIPKREELV